MAIEALSFISDRRERDANTEPLTRDRLDYENHEDSITTTRRVEFRVESRVTRISTR